MRLSSHTSLRSFASVREFHKALANGADLEIDTPKLPDDMAELIAFYKDASDKIVFTHGDMIA